MLGFLTVLAGANANRRREETASPSLMSEGLAQANVLVSVKVPDIRRRLGTVKREAPLARS
jgi:hypothetical protein